MSVNWSLTPKQSSNVLIEIIHLEQNWQDYISLSEIKHELNNVVEELMPLRKSATPTQDELYDIIDCIFDELAFSGPGLQTLPESALSSISYCVMARTGNHMSLAVVIGYLLQQLEFDAYIAEMETEVALVVRLNNSELIIIDSVSGATEYLITNDDIKESLVNSLQRLAKPIPNEELVKEVVTEQKLCLLAEEHLEEALACVETLMTLFPEDPYERRDRGLVLQQLKCDHQAVEDLEYFIKACPNDPMAAFFKNQLKEQNLTKLIIH